ncbi:MAG: excinuclease ABC subunit A [Verrucomicrobiota bacterium]
MISIHGAREHNLKDISLEIPTGRFVVITGVSGSGKSTLAFDLLFAEGQRRFLDSMNLYARQFVEQLARPDVDRIAGLPPTVSIEQRNSRGGGKSTVATVTEVHHFVRLLFARLGVQHCPDCGVAVEAQTRDALARRLEQETRKRGDLLLLAPVVRNRKGFHSDIAAWAAKEGYAELRADGRMYSTAEKFRLDRFREHNIEIVTGVLEKSRKKQPGGTSYRESLDKADRGLAGARPSELIDATLKLGQGTLFALDNHGVQTVFSTERCCPDCGRSFEPLDPKHFSYNSPQGWCPRCRGFGELFYMPEDVDRGAREDAIAESWYGWHEGERELCPDCGGARLNPVARAVRLPHNLKFQISNFKSSIDAGLTPVAFGALSVAAAAEYFQSVRYQGREAEIARDILPEIRERLKFLSRVGLGYLELGRGVPTLSGGEAQRIRLAAQLGSNLSGVCYILDEPTIGLHARDNDLLLDTLETLRSKGNSVLVVEHDEETMRRADHIIDLGPAAGVLGGRVVASGTLAELMQHPESVTGQCLRQHRNYPARGSRRPLSDAAWLSLSGAARHTLKNLTARFPLGRLVCVTGVSGSGKSTLVRECLFPALQEALRKPSRSRAEKGAAPGAARLSGFESLKAVYEVDQSPIGRTPRSIPATYVGFFDDIRALFAQVPESRLRGYSPGRFSFNSPQGRCPGCDGAGQIKLEMNFLPPAFVPCEQCGGTRFNAETLDIEYRGRNIAQVLELSVTEALEVFGGIPKIRAALQALVDTGLGYLKLGQPSPTLSGGEAQRVKLVTHLLTGLKEVRSAERGVRNGQAGSPSASVFILEEPTIGLHMSDVRRLVEVLQRLVDVGHTVVVIEHNLDLVAEADWVIDLGPEGGADGGRIVAEGTPEQLARDGTKRGSHTGRYLGKLLPRPA